MKNLIQLALLPGLLLLLSCRSAQSERSLLPGMPYRLAEITFRVDDKRLGKVINAARRKSVFKAGQPYSIYDFDKERTRLLTLLKKHGVRDPHWQSISFEVDTTLANQQFSVLTVINTGN